MERKEQLLGTRKSPLFLLRSFSFSVFALFYLASVFCSFLPSLVLLPSLSLPSLLLQKFCPPVSASFLLFRPPSPSPKFSPPVHSSLSQKSILPLFVSLPLFISRKRGSSPLLCPIVVQGGAGLPYLCRVRWPPVCKHGASVSSIIVAGYGLY